MNTNKILLVASVMMALAGASFASNCPTGVASTPSIAKESKAINSGSRRICSGFYIVGSAGYGVTNVKCNAVINKGSIIGTKASVLAGYDEATKKRMEHNAEVKKFNDVVNYWNGYAPCNPGGMAANAPGNVSGMDWGLGSEINNVIAASPAGEPGTGATLAIKNLFGKVTNQLIDALPDGYKIYAGDQVLDESGKQMGLAIDAVTHNLIINTPISLKLPDGKNIELISRDLDILGRDAIVVLANPNDIPLSYYAFMNVLNRLINSPELKATLEKEGFTLDEKAINPSPVASVSKDREELAVINTSKVEFSQHKNHMNLGAAIGGQFVIEGGFYGAIEAGAVFVPGEVEVSVKDKNKQNTYVLGNYPVAYEEAINSSKPKITLAEKYSFHATPMFGFAYGPVAFFIPVTVKMTKYEMSFTPGISGKTEIPTASVNLEKEGDAFVVYTEDATLETKKVTTKSATTQKKSVNKLSFGCGVGARFAVSKNAFVGIRYMFFPETELNFSTSPYNGAIHDQYQTGATYKMYVSSHRGSIEFGVTF